MVLDSYRFFLSMACMAGINKKESFIFYFMTLLLHLGCKASVARRVDFFPCILHPCGTMSS